MVTWTLRVVEHVAVDRRAVGARPRGSPARARRRRRAPSSAPRRASPRCSRCRARRRARGGRRVDERAHQARHHLRRGVGADVAVDLAVDDEGEPARVVERDRRLDAVRLPARCCGAARAPTSSHALGVPIASAGAADADRAVAPRGRRAGAREQAEREAGGEDGRERARRARGAIGERDGDEAERGEQRRRPARQQPGADRSGIRPKPPASEPAIAPAVFHA